MTFAGLKEVSGYRYRTMGTNKVYPIFKSTARDPFDDLWESFPLSPEKFHKLLDCLPNNNTGLNVPYQFISMIASIGNIPPTIAKFDRALDKNGTIFQFAKCAAGHYSNGYSCSTYYHEQVYIITLDGSRICITEDYTLGPPTRNYNIQ